MAQRSAKNSKQTLRTRRVPPALEQWLGVVNDVPEQSEVEEAANSALQIATRFVQPCPEEHQLIAELRSRLANWGPAAQRAIFTDDLQNAADLGQRLLGLGAAKRAFQIVANSKDSLTPRALPLPIERSASLWLESGKLSVKLAPFLEALQGLEVERLRICPICSQIFWAGRLDKSGCSENCSRVLRQRRLRENRIYRKAHPKTKRK